MWAGSQLPSRAAYGRAAGVSVTPETVAGVPAVTAAVGFAANEVASLCLETWRGKGVDARAVDGSWQGKLFERRPNPQQTRFDFWSTVEESLSYRGNAFIWKQYDDAGRVAVWWALHPDQVAAEWTRDASGIQYVVTVGNGFVDPTGRGSGSYRLRSEVLHIRGFGDGGALLAPSPIERHLDALGAAVAKPKYEAALYANNATGGLSVTFPENITVEEAREWRDLITEQYEGPANALRSKIFGGGVDVKSIGLSQADAQYVESVGMSVQEVARIFRVQVSLLDGEHGSDPLSPEHEMQRWLRLGLLPRLARIESALLGDADLFGPAARLYPRFNTDRVVRGDLTTQETIDHQQVQDGRLLVDEWRAQHGLPPLPGGVGMIPQVVPVGGAPNPGTPVEVPQENTRATVVERERETIREFSSIELRPEIHMHQERQDITVAAPQWVVNVEPTPIEVRNIVEPASVTVDAPILIESPVRHVSLERDASGRLVGATVEDNP